MDAICIRAFNHKGGRGKTGGISEYARQHGREQQQVDMWVKAYRVAKNYNSVVTLQGISYRILYEISKSPELSWQPLCQHALDDGWTVKQTKDMVKRVKDINNGINRPSVGHFLLPHKPLPIFQHYL